jgi:hypothetical protein
MFPAPSQAYFDRLFALADVTGAGKISGSSAVSFLTKSQIPLPALKAIWSLSDTSGSHALDRPQFYVALRFIQILQAVMAQTGSLQSVRITQDLLKAHSQKELRPPTFDGVDIGTSTGPSVGSEVASSTPAAVTSSDQYAMTPSERERYDTLFPAYSTNNDGFIYGSEAVALFSKSGLDRQALRQIWNLSDEPVDNRLSKVSDLVMTKAIDDVYMPAMKSQTLPHKNAFLS